MLQDHLLTGRCFKAIMNGKGFLASSQWWATPPSPCYPQLVLKLLRKGAAAFYDSPSLTHEDKPRENGNPLLNTPSECLLPESSGKTYSLGTGMPEQRSWRCLNEHFQGLHTTANSTRKSKSQGNHKEWCKESEVTKTFYLLSNIREITLKVSKMAQGIKVLADDP